MVLLRWEAMVRRNLVDVVSLRDLAKLDMRNWKLDEPGMERLSGRVLEFSRVELSKEFVLNLQSDMRIPGIVGVVTWCGLEVGSHRICGGGAGACRPAGGGFRHPGHF